MTLPEQVSRVREEVASHKAALHRHRRQLGLAKTKLAKLEAECRARGIRLIYQPAGEEEECSSWPAPPHQS